MISLQNVTELSEFTVTSVNDRLPGCAQNSTRGFNIWINNRASFVSFVFQRKSAYPSFLFSQIEILWLYPVNSQISIWLRRKLGYAGFHWNANETKDAWCPEIWPYTWPYMNRSVMQNKWQWTAEQELHRCGISGRRNKYCHCASSANVALCSWKCDFCHSYVFEELTRNKNCRQSLAFVYSLFAVHTNNVPNSCYEPRYPVVRCCAT